MDPLKSLIEAPTTRLRLLEVRRNVLLAEAISYSSAGKYVKYLQALVGECTSCG